MKKTFIVKLERSGWFNRRPVAVLTYASRKKKDYNFAAFVLKDGDSIELELPKTMPYPKITQGEGE